MNPNKQHLSAMKKKKQTNHLFPNCVRINHSKKLNYLMFKGNTLRTQAALMIHDSGHKLKLCNRDMIGMIDVQFIGN